MGVSEMTLVTQFQNILDLETEIRSRWPCHHSRSGVGGHKVRACLGLSRPVLGERRSIADNPVGSRTEQWMCAWAGLRPQVGA